MMIHENRLADPIGPHFAIAIVNEWFEMEAGVGFRGRETCGERVEVRAESEW